jgi:hypothetical protein
MVRRELPAATLAVVAAAVLVLLIYVGSRGLKDFDSALVGYAVASVFAFAAVVYRYTRWITRPPTWRGPVTPIWWCSIRCFRAWTASRSAVVCTSSPMPTS